ncbi:hypothetical protein SAMN04487967_2785 [Natronorubrum sediminis]|uniref:TRAP transporter solute receptor, TAXI family n=1 Tax=Natronorubrum sediminis TaxID=640943 RepID=A0A1H6G253_9EURY|nr:TAXI family TRAP transporter solute-binding subunit [Natronorubrum sediminis]SEH16682.1 hypothetical protein SAMN04487967_2785 [Natronorubrum sediminis]
MAHQPSGQSTVSTRRSFLYTAGVGTSAVLAGCLGGNQGEPIRMRTSTEGTTAYAANQGIAAVINEHSDELFPEAQTSPGTEANVGALMREEAEMAYLQDWAAYEVTEGIDEYGDLEFQMAQVFHFYDLPWFFCTADEDIETIEDATSDTTISPTPEGSGTAPALEYMLENAIGDYNRVSLTYDEQANAMEEGRLDIGVGTYMNFDTEPGWLQEMMSTVDLRILDVADETVEEWENDERLFIESFDGSELEEGESTPESVPDEIQSQTFAHNFVSRADLEYDLVYDFLEELHEHRESLDEYHGVLGPLEDEEFWVENAYDDMPFHAAAADFFEELGVWSDDLERAEEP